MDGGLDSSQWSANGPRKLINDIVPSIILQQSTLMDFYFTQKCNSRGIKWKYFISWRVSLQNIETSVREDLNT